MKKYLFLGGLVGVVFMGLVWWGIEERNRPYRVGDTVYSYVDYQQKRDGDSFHLRNRKEKLRLAGIDAPESNQRCTRDDRTVWECGMASIKGFDQIVQNRKLKCQIVSKDFYPNRFDAICWVGDKELNKAMVENGWAFAAVKYDKRYLPSENDAKAHQRGIWANGGKVQAPWDFRKATK